MQKWQSLCYNIDTIKKKLLWGWEVRQMVGGVSFRSAYNSIDRFMPTDRSGSLVGPQTPGLLGRAPEIGALANRVNNQENAERQKGFSPGVEGRNGFYTNVSAFTGRNRLNWTSYMTERSLKRMGLKECETCENRKYQDESEDPGVSFQNATHLSPEAAPAAVRGHEQEHVVREQDKAEKEGKRVAYQSVILHSAICPECGRPYISGGETRTVMVKKKAIENFEPGKELDQRI